MLVFVFFILSLLCIYYIYIYIIVLLQVSKQLHALNYNPNLYPYFRHAIIPYL
jgi:hypothetical protein